MLLALAMSACGEEEAKEICVPAETGYNISVTKPVPPKLFNSPTIAQK